MSKGDMLKELHVSDEELEVIKTALNYCKHAANNSVRGKCMDHSAASYDVLVKKVGKVLESEKYLSLTK